MAFQMPPNTSYVTCRDGQGQQHIIPVPTLQLTNISARMAALVNPNTQVIEIADYCFEILSAAFAIELAQQNNLITCKIF